MDKIPAFLGRVRQLPVPYWLMQARSLASSSGVQGPLFTESFSQHGALPIIILIPTHLSNYKNNYKFKSKY